MYSVLKSEENEKDRLAKGICNNVCKCTSSHSISTMILSCSNTAKPSLKIVCVFICGCVRNV